MPTPEQQEEDLVRAVIELPPDHRSAFLDSRCAGNPKLRARLEALLTERLQAGASPTQTVAQAQTIKLNLSPLEEESVGKAVGRYRILEKVGEGGCGVVYVAEQTEPVRRRVALKVIKLGMDTKAVVARFEAERQALAMMDHPNIAKVLDAGATENGRPYFVMELVRGIRITEYCDQNNLTTGERIDLFVKVCQAIQHAHQKGIIHRDIKPSNILVTLHDGSPVPKVIDFGIAKATEGRLSDATVYTQLHQFVGTPAYMSPEQAEMSGLDIDTRSDIYSLGVLLYELLTGQTPFDAHELASQGLDAMRKAIREKEPARPSTKVATLKDEDRTTTAKRRSVDAPKLLHQLRGDLDWIVMKCLEKDRTRRYDTANGLALDLKRHLNNEPVLARPPSAAYRFQKALRRNKVIYGAAAAVLIALTAGLSLAAIEWRQTRMERDRALAAETEAESQRKSALASEQKALEAQGEEAKLRAKAEAAEKAARKEVAKQEAVNKFLNQMFAAADPDALTAPDVSKGATGTVVDMLDAAARQLESGELKERPEIEAVIRQTLGKTYESRGQYAAADEQLRRALELDRKVEGPESLATARTLDALAHLRLSQDRLPEAEQLQSEDLAIQQNLHGGKDDPDVARAMFDLANIRMEEVLGTVMAGDQKRLSEAEAAFRAALAMQRRVLPKEDRNIANTLTVLGRLLSYRQNLDESEAMLKEALAMQTDLLGPEHPDVAFTMQELAEPLEFRGRFAEAEQLCRRAAAIQRKTLGNEHPALATTLLRLGMTLDEQDKPAEAEAPLRESLAIRRSALGENNIHVAWCLRTLAECLAAQKKWAQAEEVYREELPAWAKARGMDTDGYHEAVKGLVASLTSQGKAPEIETVFNQTLAEERASLGETSPFVAATLQDFGQFLASRKRTAEAEKKYDEALQIIVSGDARELAKVPDIVDQTAQRLLEHDEYRDAEKLYQQTIKMVRAKVGDTDAIVGRLEYRYGRVFLQEAKWDEAGAQFLKAWDAFRVTMPDRVPDALRTAGAMLLKAGKFAEAERYMKEAIAERRRLDQPEDFWSAAAPTAQLGLALYGLHKVAESEQALRDAVVILERANPSDDPVHWLRPQCEASLVYVLKQENKLAEAEILRKKFFSEQSPIVMAADMLYLADLWKAGGRADAGVDWTNEVAAYLEQARPGDAMNVAPVLVGILFTNGYTQAATNVCRQMLAASSTNAEWFGTTATYLVTAANPDAIDPALPVELAKKATALAPDAPTGWAALGMAHYRAKDFKQSAAELEKAMQLGYENVRASFFRAMACRQLGQTEAARNLYTQAAQWLTDHNPDDPDLRRTQEEADQIVNSKSAKAQ